MFNSLKGFTGDQATAISRAVEKQAAMYGNTRRMRILYIDVRCAGSLAKVIIYPFLRDDQVDWMQGFHIYRYDRPGD